MQHPKLKIFLSGILVYLLSTGIAYAGFSLMARSARGRVTFTSPIPTLLNVKQNSVKIDPAEPKTEVCPLNGELFTKTEKQLWATKRPLAVMIENHTAARPQSGLSYADIVYEAVAEGGITRFMGIFYCGIAAHNVQLAPIRSARTYFLDWVSEYDALYNHVGGAGQCNDPTVDNRAKALCQIRKYQLKDLDQFGISYPTCFRNPDRLGHPVATEHQMVCLTNGLYKIAKERKWTNVDAAGIAWDRHFKKWKFVGKEDNQAQAGAAAGTISFGFWDGYEGYQVRWEYDKDTNGYHRFNGGKLQIDFATKKPLLAKNVVVQFTREKGPVDEHKHLLYTTIGRGEALIFQNGIVIEGSWQKQKRTARTLFFAQTGKEIKFIPGQIWIEVVPAGKKVEYQ